MSGSDTIEVKGIQDGTKRKCAGSTADNDHQVEYSVGKPTGWHHLSKQDWNDKPHKASPKRPKRRSTVPAV